MIGSDAATIFALSSGAPPAAVAVVRVSGPAAGDAIVRLHGSAIAARRATLGWLRCPLTGEPLDRGLLLWLPGPGSATGEDMAELHLHGGRAVVAAVTNALARLPGLRPAAPGEFTRRAFANGIIDLAQAEGLADLLAAETESQRRTAARLADGMLSRKIERLQRSLLGLAASVEAKLDFADDDDVGLEDGGVGADLVPIGKELRALLTSPSAERLRDGIRVVLAGPPNSGKSTLLNALVGRDAAITAPKAGTTRDLIEAPVAIDGIPFVLIDTAGLRDAAVSSVESIGIERARSAAASADILLWLGDPATAPRQPSVVLIHPRCDARGRRSAPEGALAVSAVTGIGIGTLTRTLTALAGALLPSAGEVALSRRQHAAVGDCVAGLDEAIASDDPLLVAEGLRSALAALDRLTGRAGAEEMLDALFGRFCIGK